MFWFSAALYIDVAAVLFVIGNFFYQSFIAKYPTGYNLWLNIAGVLVLIIIFVARSLRDSGDINLATRLLWIPAAPICLGVVFFVLAMIIIRTN
ncbi:hypothetical protein [Dyadobacter pollutisoli]|jgi:hypothetical protein|uniref:Uncharacterized protein n=1 Tax=Dyadobacter pollutisoli TaxID=2910158 RepID=A0A9E8NA08_9BACT|nr:hypothetical protein [Dyadobacter pollutisoli]WAC12745.1 hypothetical protein ON006_02020 [Dyadobacter pollutisoli]